MGIKTGAVQLVHFGIMHREIDLADGNGGRNQDTRDERSAPGADLHGILTRNAQSLRIDRIQFGLEA